MFLSYLTGARYVHLWWRGRFQSCNQVPARCCNVCGRNLITGLKSAASPRVDISSTCKIGQKIGVSLPLMTWSPSAWPYRLLYRGGRKSRRYLWTTRYIHWSYNKTTQCEEPKFISSVSVTFPLCFYKSNVYFRYPTNTMKEVFYGSFIRYNCYMFRLMMAQVNSRNM
jgi:hypothetical protein